MKLYEKNVLLTGASGGIGRCIALELARRRARVALAGRRETRLRGLAAHANSDGAFATALPCDLTAPDGPAMLYERAVDELGSVDILINNAGQSCFGPLADEEESKIRHVVGVNLTASILLAREVLPAMLKRRSGHIVNIGSAVGSIGLPQFATYSATKFALRGFSEALRRELAGSGITVTYVAPRTTDTTMNTRAVRDAMAQSGAAMDAPEKVARIVVNAIEDDRSDVYIGWPERLFVRLNALLPGLVDRSLAGQSNRTPRTSESPN